MALAPGDVFAGYTVVRALGSGGMGDVYLVRHPRLPRLDALKLLRRDLSGDASFAARFRREADTAARISHPNIVPVLDRGEDAGQLWMTMQYVVGRNAEEELVAAGGLLPPERVAHVITGVAAALDSVHRHWLVHRDVKPANILLSDIPSPEFGDVFLTDFGIAKALDATTNLTVRGGVMASFDYASPEQIESGDLDARADVYSLGCVLVTLLTGEVPYPGETLGAAIHGHLTRTPPRPSERVPWLAPAIDDVVSRALAKDRDERYSTCLELAAAVSRAINAFPPPPPLPYEVTLTRESGEGSEVVGPLRTDTLPRHEVEHLVDLVTRSRLFELPADLRTDDDVPARDSSGAVQIDIASGPHRRSVVADLNTARRPQALADLIPTLERLRDLGDDASVPPGALRASVTAGRSADAARGEQGLPEQAPDPPTTEDASAGSVAEDRREPVPSSGTGADRQESGTGSGRAKVPADPESAGPAVDLPQRHPTDLHAEPGRGRRWLPLAIALLVIGVALVVVVQSLTGPTGHSPSGSSSRAATAATSPPSGTPPTTTASPASPSPPPVISDPLAVRAVATVDVGAQVEALAEFPGNQQLFVSHTAAGGGSNLIAVLDSRSGHLIRDIPLSVSSLVSGLAPSPDGALVYATDFGGDSVLVVDVAGGRVVNRFAAPGSPMAVAVSQDGSRLYVAEYDASTVRILDARSGAQLGSVPVGRGPSDLAWSPDHVTLWVSSFFDNSVTKVDANAATRTTTAPAGDRPLGVAASPDGKYVYVSDGNTGTVTVLDAGSAAQTGTVQLPGSEPRGISVSPDSRFVYVAQGSGNVAVLENGAVLGEISVSTAAYVLATSDGTALWIASGFDTLWAYGA